ncbi:unnamed protein product [Paramecium pentaurelia]|uniref:U3 small nucleolar RNA-associated protein 6 N-terminal domain-containing protein n=1 Tax=Paramecium pentaurelia TaxID=43138 RepID=A0A8S1SNH0_9CILI|nr:unnamed protein product [Paramecium pentaurelia]
MADKIRYTLEKFIPDLLALQKKQVFSKDEVKDILHKREEFEYMLQRRTHNLSNYMQLLDYEYGLERLRRQRNKERQVKKVTTRDYAIVKRIIYIWDRIMNKYRYNIDLWKQYLSFCYIIESKKHFFKVITKALNFNPYNTDLWLAGALFELEKAHNPIKARKIFYQALRINNKNIDLWGSYLDFELNQLQIGQEQNDEIKNIDGFLPLNTVEPITQIKSKKLDGIKQIIQLAIENCDNSELRKLFKKILLRHNQNELAEEISQTQQLNNSEQIIKFLIENQNDIEVFDKLKELNVDYKNELLQLFKDKANTLDTFWSLAFQQPELQSILLTEIKNKPIKLKIQLVQKGYLSIEQINVQEISKLKNKKDLLEILLLLVHLYKKEFSFDIAKQNLLGQTELFETFLDEYYPLLNNEQQQQLLNWLEKQKQFCPLKYHKLRKLDFVQLIKLTEYHPNVDTWKFVLEQTKQQFPQKITQVMTSIQFLDPQIRNQLLK